MVKRENENQRKTRVKVKIEVPFIFKTRLSVRITDLNYGNHLANDRILSYVHEARVAFLTHLGYSEIDISGVGIIMSDAVIQFKNQGYYADEISISVAIANWQRKSVDILYEIKNIKSEKILALVKTGIVFFDYDIQKPVAVPEEFKQRIEDMPEI